MLEAFADVWPTAELYANVVYQRKVSFSFHEIPKLVYQRTGKETRRGGKVLWRKDKGDQIPVMTSTAFRIWWNVLKWQDEREKKSCLLNSSVTNRSIFHRLQGLIFCRLQRRLQFSIRPGHRRPARTALWDWSCFRNIRRVICPSRGRGVDFSPSCAYTIYHWLAQIPLGQKYRSGLARPTRAWHIRPA